MAASRFIKAYLCEEKQRSSRVEFQFNPSTISFTKKPHYGQPPNQTRGTGKPQYLGAEPMTLDVQLFLDAVERPGTTVEPAVQRLVTWATPATSTGGKAPSPPMLLFVWGSLRIGDQIGFRGHLTSVQVTYKVFSPDGAPLRADVKVDMAEAGPDEQPTKTSRRQNPTSGAVAAYRVHRVARGDSLASIAYATYGEAGMWRALAITNGIDDPMRLAPGTELLLPDHNDLRGVG